MIGYSLLLDRITELETNPATNPGAQIPLPPFSAFPKALLTAQSQKLFISNLRVAIDELDREDPDIDPHLLSRHVGPSARKRQEAEQKERQEEEAREAKRVNRKPRGRKDPGNPLTYAPSPTPSTSQQGAASANGAGTPLVLLSSGVTRLRLKPPAPPEPNQARENSPVSPVHSPKDEERAPSPQFQSAPPPPPTQASMQLTLRTSTPQAGRPSDIQRHTKPKRLKAHTVTTRSYSIPTVPRDKRGKPILPLNVGIMTVIHLGEVCMREHFHTERYIFPVGYEVTRCGIFHGVVQIEFDDRC